MLKRFSHWSPSYVRNRIAVAAYERANPSAPWLTSQMTEILDSWLKPSDIGIEWGSGRSTAWLAARALHLTTIEDNPQWAERVADMLAQSKIRERVEIMLAPLSAEDRDKPAASAYVEMGRRVASASLDFALVDGALRDHCTEVAIQKLKRGGVLIIDNVERYIPSERRSTAPASRGLRHGFASSEWALVFDAIKDWRCIYTSNGVSDTALWVKP